MTNEESDAGNTSISDPTSEQVEVANIANQQPSSAEQDSARKADLNSSDAQGNSFGFLSAIQPVSWMAIGAALISLVLVVWGRIGFWDFVLTLVALALVRWLIFVNVNANVQGQTAQERSSSGLAKVFAVVDAIVAPTFVLDAKTNILHRNIAAAGQLPRAETGAPITFAIRNPDFLQILETAQLTDLPEQVEFQQPGENAQWYRVSVAPFKVPGVDSSDEQTLLLVVFENQTEQKRTEDMRVDFIANASHELRTPLTSVLGFIDTLLGPAAKDPGAHEKFLGIMRAQAERMSNLVEDLMSLSRIELRQHVLPSGEANISAVWREVIEGFDSQLAQADMSVHLELPENDVLISGDRDELYQVFTNLLENAIKYGEEGKKVDVEIQSDIGRNAEAVNISVTDYGIGIAPEHVPRLTERFYRVDAESSRRKKGTGLGLAIVKHIVQRHRGELSIRSQLGLGTRVEIILPK